MLDYKLQPFLIILVIPSALAEEAGHRRPGALRLHGPAGAGDADARARAAQLPRGARRRRQPHRARRHHGGVPPRPAGLLLLLTILPHQSKLQG